MMDAFLKITVEEKVYTEKEKRIRTIQPVLFFENYYVIHIGNNV